MGNECWFCYLIIIFSDNISRFACVQFVSVSFECYVPHDLSIQFHEQILAKIGGHKILRMSILLAKLFQSSRSISVQNEDYTSFSFCSMIVYMPK